MAENRFGTVIIVLLLIGLCIGVVGAGLVIDNVETTEYYVAQDTYSLSVGTTASMEKFRMNVDSFQDITLIVLNAHNADFLTVGSGSGDFTLQIGAVVYGTGSWSCFPGATGDTVLHMQFNSWDRKTLTGWQDFTMGGSTPSFSVAGGVGSKFTSIGSTKTQVGFRRKLNGAAMPFYQSNVYHKYTGEANVYSNETESFISSWVQRAGFDGGNAYTSTVTYTRGDDVVMSSSNGATNTTPYYMVDEYTTLSILFPNGYSWEKVYFIDGNYAPSAPTPTPTPTLPSCGVDVDLSLSKYTSIFPYEYINGTISITGDTPLNSGSSIRWMTGPGPGSSATKETVAVFSNVSGTWYVTRSDLGIVSGPTPTTYEDVLAESVRFPDAGNYVVRVSVVTDGGCSVYDEKSLQVFPTSGVNVDFYFRDCLTGNLLGDAVASIENVGITGCVTYTGNPIGIAAQIGHNLSVNATASGYTFAAFNYIVPGVTGNTLDVPVYLCPEEIGDIHPGNTSLIVNVRSQSTTEPIQGAYVVASGGGVTIDSGYSNSMGYTMLQIPFRPGNTKIDVTAFPYHSQSKYLALNNATSYEETFWMLYSGTPTPTPTVTYDPNATYTPTVTATDTPAPTTTVVTKPKLVVEVVDSRYGYTVPIPGASVKLYAGSTANMAYKGSLIQTAITATNGRTDTMQMNANDAYWCDVSKTGYYTSSERFRMSAYDSTRFVQLIPVGGNVTVEPTGTTGPGGIIYPDIGDTETTGWVSMFIEKVMELFGVNEWAARTILGLMFTLLSAVFVGGCLAGFGSGEGAAMGALIGGCFGWIFACLVGFIPIWLLIVSIAFVGMAFFVWHRAGGAGGG